MMEATIIPGVNKDGVPSLGCQGTRIEVFPGMPLHGVTSITLVARVGDVWRAHVECLVRVQPIKARVRLKLPRPARYYRRGGRAIWR